MPTRAGGRGNMKGFYKQQKKKGITTSRKSKKSALVSRGSIDLKDDFDENEELLRQFDMNMAYGPCLGMTRLARWERANSLGMNPLQIIADLLKSEKNQSVCLWDGLLYYRYLH